MKCLVVEDDLASANLIVRMTHKLGASCKVARDGAEAWECILAERINLIISDWMMPNLDGLALCRKLRERTQEHYTYFILVSVIEHSVEHRIEAMRAGVDDFLAKPIDATELAIRFEVARRVVASAAYLRLLQNRVLTICSYTKKVKVGENQWVTMEEFFGDLLGVRFTHGISPDQFEKLQTDLESFKRSHNAARTFAGQAATPAESPPAPGSPGT